MAKSVFRPVEIKNSEEKVMLQLTKSFAPEVEEEEIEEEPEYTGPTAEDLRREADEFKLQWEKEKQQLLANTEAEAKKIVDNAESTAFDVIKRKTDEAAIIKQKAQTEADQIIKEAEQKALDLIQEAEIKRNEQMTQAYDEGYQKGSEDGFQDGNKEAQRLIDRLHVIIEKTMVRRQEILDETEQQIVDLVLLMTRKVVKVISENQRTVVMNNIVQALRKVKGRGDVTIRVNLADVELTTEHTNDFIQAVENIKNISVVEDSSVDRGGCIVETDFGAIDARISSQLTELEQRILEISPIKTITKTSAIKQDF